MELLDIKKFKIKTDKNNEMELSLRNYNNEELSITLSNNNFNNNENNSKKYELKCNL